MAYIKLEDLMAFPIRIDHYDKENGNEHFVYGVETVLEYAENLPIADVAPVVHGRWIPKYEIKKMYYSPDDVENYKVPDGFSCSRCGRVEYRREPYCNCGARMDGG